MSATLADALRQFGSAYLANDLANHLLSTAQAKAWRAIVTFPPEFRTFQN